MNRFIHGIAHELEVLRLDLNSALPCDLKIYARKLAKCELELQAARSLLEARLFDAEIDNMEKEKQVK